MTLELVGGFLMNETFVFLASCVCMLVGILLCALPANRYFRTIGVGAMGPLLLVCGVVLMTTFKWDEVAIKLSGLELKLAEAQENLDSVQARFAAVEKSITPQAQSQALAELLDKYEQVSSTTPSDTQVKDFGAALTAANVTVLPLSTLNAVFTPVSPDGELKGPTLR
jgi:hypothetical protein